MHCAVPFVPNHVLCTLLSCSVQCSPIGAITSSLCPGSSQFFNVAFLCATLKNWEEPGDDAIVLSYRLCTLINWEWPGGEAMY